MQFRRKVKKGSQTGRKIGFPTLNFEVGNFGEYYDPGVYISEIEIEDKGHIGALYYGPKMHHEGDVLEIYVLDFDGQVYGQFVQFKIIKKTRSPKAFTNLDDLKKQIEMDIENIV